MTTLTFVPLGWTWLHNDMALRWELGFYQQDLPRCHPWHCHAWMNDEFIENVHPEAFLALLRNLARFAVERDATFDS